MKEFQTIIDKCKIFFSLKNLQTGSVTHMCNIICFLGEKRAGRKLATHIHILPKWIT
jgi:hypothetical protein